MDATDIIALAGAHGVTLTAQGTHILARPASALTDELRQAIRSHKTALLTTLASDNRSTSTDPDTVADRRTAGAVRPQADMSRTETRNDGRAKDSHTGVQTGIDAGTEDGLTEPGEPCPSCGSGQWWQLPGQPWHCRSCLEITDTEQARATTLTGGLWEPSA